MGPFLHTCTEWVPRRWSIHRVRRHSAEGEVPSWFLPPLAGRRNGVLNSCTLARLRPWPPFPTPQSLQRLRIGTPCELGLARTFGEGTNAKRQYSLPRR